MTHAPYLHADKLAQATGGFWHHTPPEHFESVEIDNRKLGDNGLFIALSGAQTDGHQFVCKLSAERNQAAIVSAVQSCVVPQLVTADPLSALQQIAAMCATATNGAKIAITGSVGKTGTKEIIAHILSKFGATHASSGNFNNHIGLPITLANLPEDAEFIITEMGMNHAGEIATLSALATPHIAAITRIADSHIGHFSSLEEIAYAKAEIFSSLSGPAVAVLPKDDAHYAILEAEAKAAGALKIISFGSGEDADFQLLSARQTPQGQRIEIALNHNENAKNLSFEIGMQAPHWALNSLCALAVCSAAGIPAEKASAVLFEMHDLKGRGKATPLYLNGKHAVLIDDAYNASPESMKASLAALAKRSDEANKSAILSDMLELGEASEPAHLRLADEIHAAGITTFIAIGPMMSKLATQLEAKVNTICFEDADALLADAGRFNAISEKLSEIILVKGSHGSGAYKIADLLADHYAVGEHDAT